MVRQNTYRIHLCSSKDEMNWERKYKKQTQLECWIKRKEKEKKKQKHDPGGLAFFFFPRVGLQVMIAETVGDN